MARTSHARGDNNTAFCGANVRQGEFGQQDVRREVDVDHFGNATCGHVGNGTRGHNAVIAEQDV